MLSTITITFSECVENHKGMQTIGNKSLCGYSIDNLLSYEKEMQKIGHKTEIIPIICGSENAALFIIRNAIFGEDYINLKNELYNLTYDSQAYMYGRVVEKHARHNLCFADIDQTADVANKMGTVVDFKHLPYLSKLRNFFTRITGDILYAEANYYYDINKCGIGYHGDTERSKVIGVRIGEAMSLHYQWYYRNAPVGDNIKIMLYPGDIYIMSDKAVGNDWKCSSKYTLRHAAGADKYTVVKHNVE